MTARPEIDVIPFATAVTLPGLFALRVQRSPDEPAYRQFDSVKSEWQRYTWRETGVRVAEWKRALAREHLDQGDRVAILLRNSVEWVCFDQAALALGLVLVPLYLSDTADNIAYISGRFGRKVAAHRNTGPLENAGTALRQSHPRGKSFMPATAQRGCRSWFQR